MGFSLSFLRNPFKWRVRLALALMSSRQMPMWVFGKGASQTWGVPLFMRDRSTSGAKAIATPHGVSPMGVTKRIRALGPPSIDLSGGALDCVPQPQLRGRQAAAPRRGTETPSSHPELAEGDGIVLFNGRVRGISFSRRLKHSAITAGAGSERQSLRAGSSTVLQKECQILHAEC